MQMKKSHWIFALCTSLVVASVSLTACKRQQAPASSEQAQASPSQVPQPSPPDLVLLSEEEMPEVPYVTTPPEVVDEMLKMADVKPEDVVYDLGCGDGRIVITAATRFGARGVGVDINPHRIKESNENAQKAGVTDRVKFIQQDLFDLDISEASVVAIYLFPDVNARLRPKLLRELKPGTRIVSHNYGIGSWKPLKTQTMETADGKHTIFYWVVPEKKNRR